MDAARRNDTTYTALVTADALRPVEDRWVEAMFTEQRRLLNTAKMAGVSTDFKGAASLRFEAALNGVVDPVISCARCDTTAHGAAHNDPLCTQRKKTAPALALLRAQLTALYAKVYTKAKADDDLFR